MTKEIMTLWYRAPEVLLDNLAYSKHIDLWSVGVIIFEMLCGTQMFRANSEIDMIIKILNLLETKEESMYIDKKLKPEDLVIETFKEEIKQAD